MPVDTNVRERLRAAQRAESTAIAAVQKAQAAQAHAKARIEQIVLRHQGEMSKAARDVQTAQASLVRASGLERAAALLDVSAHVLKVAVKETTADAKVETARFESSSIQAASAQTASDENSRVGHASDQATSSRTPDATTAPTIAPAMT